MSLFKRIEIKELLFEGEAVWSADITMQDTRSEEYDVINAPTLPMLLVKLAAHTERMLDMQAKEQAHNAAQ